MGIALRTIPLIAFRGGEGEMILVEGLVVSPSGRATGSIASGKLLPLTLLSDYPPLVSRCSRCQQEDRLAGTIPKDGRQARMAAIL